VKRVFWPERLNGFSRGKRVEQRTYVLLANKTNELVSRPKACDDEPRVADDPLPAHKIL